MQDEAKLLHSFLSDYSYNCALSNNANLWTVHSSILQISSYILTHYSFYYIAPFYVTVHFMDTYLF